MQESTIHPADPKVDYHGGRILVPRRERPPASDEESKRPRAPRACTTCRKRKTKCTAGQPRCHECETNGLTCSYDQGRRDRLKELLEQKQLLVTMVKDIRQDASLKNRKKIESVLEALDEEFPDLPSATPQEEHNQQAHTNQSMHMANQELNQSATREISYAGFGLMSYAWNQNITNGTEDPLSLLSLQHELGLQSEDDRNRTYPPQLVTSYLSNRPTLDESSSIVVEDIDVDARINAHNLPPFEIASRLFQHYARTVHDWFQFLPFAFEDQVRIYYAMPYQVSDHWLATLNLVFAIGAQHSFLVNETGNDMDGLDARLESVRYLNKALQLLRVKEDALLIPNPEVPLVQCLGLLSLYYLAAGHVDRAWVTVGIAFRAGILLGLHLRSPESSTWPSRADTLSRTWWALRTLECLVSSITGRPSAIPLQDCNVPLPSIPSNGPSGQDLAVNLQLYVKISITSQWALSSLYSVRAATLPWQSIEGRALKLVSELELLLPDIADRERSMLHFSWFDSMILVTRPCLCPRRCNDNSDEPSPVTQGIGRQCIQAAQAMTRLLPNRPDERIFRNGPWWCLCHYIMRAMTVFLLAMSDRVPLSISVGSDIVPSIKKLVRWLQWMRQKSFVAEKSLEVVLDTLRRSHDPKNFADIFEQEVVDAYGGSLLVPGRWEIDTTAPYPQFLPDLNEWDDMVDSAGVLNNMVRQSSTDMPVLPMPFVYDTPFGLGENTWHS